MRWASGLNARTTAVRRDAAAAVANVRLTTRIPLSYRREGV
jgi:hypothetical protein